MEKETRIQRLVSAVSADYPNATESLVSFPDEWELIRQIQHAGTSFYVAAMSASQEQPREDQFYGLPAEINSDLSRYRMYRLFEPWPMPSAIISWNTKTGQGRVIGEGDLKVQLQVSGQAQAWFGKNLGVLW